ncbi:MAG: 50S ribosomal protein L25 [Fidelibacterota bacterium]
MPDLELKVERRDKTGKVFARKYRGEEKIPGIYYSHGEKSIPILIAESELRNALRSGLMILPVSIDGRRKRRSILKEIQYHPVTGKIIHVDIMGVRKGEYVHLNIPVYLEGTAEGVKSQGGIVQQSLRELEIRCLPEDIPDQVVIDISKLYVGDSIHVNEIKLDNVEILSDKGSAIVTIIQPTRVAKVKVEEEAEEEGVAAPEEGKEIPPAESGVEGSGEKEE